MKKVIVWLFAVLMVQMVAASDVDLYRGLLFWITDQNNIEGNELRKTTYPLSQVFDGSFYNQLAGTAIPKRDNQDYTFSLSFKVGELNCINRLLVIGSHSIYLDTDNKLYYNGLNTTFTVDATNKYYSLVFRVDESHRLTIYAGVKDQRLSQVMSSVISGYLNFSSSVGMSSFTFGYGSKPSTGNLQSGQFANIRFWTRALSDEECAMVDKSLNVILETKPLGCPTGVKYDFFPLNGNMFGVDESSTTPKCSTYNVSALGMMPSIGRSGNKCEAVSSTEEGNIVFTKFHKVFDGGYVLNNGYELTTSTYNESRSWTQIGTHWDTEMISVYPYDAIVSSDADVDASYCFWIKPNKFPSVDKTILCRTLSNWKNANGTIISEAYQNRELNIIITPNGHLKLSGSGVEPTEFSNYSLKINRWNMITVVGKREQWIRVYLNDNEVGLVPSSMTLGYLPPLDKRYVSYNPKYGGSYSSQHGDVIDADYNLSIGGFDGAIDGLSFFSKDLNTNEIKVLYEEGAPQDPDTAITPTTRNFSTDGGGGAIITSGSAATWWARVTEPWITLNANSGNIGYPVAYTVSATTNAEQRVGFVYVNGHAHEVTQDGLGGTIDSNGATYEKAGGSGTIAVGVQNGIAWKATADVDWLSVSPTNGVGSGSVTYQVAAYDEVATRQGTLTIAGNTFTVFQYGRRMKLEPTTVTQNYETHVIPITVNALDITQWSVTPNNSWISVVDAGNGQGGDLVSIAIAENPSYRARTGTVTIGTETFTVTQQGRPTAALSFSVSPTASTASVEGANGLIAVTATPDLPWTATSGANWITIYAATANGAGNGNVVYSASPNPTLSQRTGTITITPETASGMTAKTHTVTQPAAQSALSSNGYEFEASGEPCSVEVSVANIVQWSISESLDWITVNGTTSRVGPGTVTLQATANDTVYPRSGTVTIAGKTFRVSQKARGVELEYDTKLFGTDGGYESISIHPDGNVSWTAVASDATWITIFQGDSGTGDGEIMYIVSPYNGNGTARTGWITVGDKKVYISQRAYDLNIEPNGTNVVGNAGAGEFGVSADINDVWTAIVTEPWITLVSGYDSGTGGGTVRFIYTENNTGKTRTGKIIVAGEIYTLEQRARTMVAITATAEHGGHVSGGGSYDLGTQVTLEAVPDSGYKFSYWTGAVSSMQNPLTVTADVAKSYTAVFEPLPIAFTSVVSDTNGVTLAWNNLAWAGTYRIYRGVTSVPSSATVLAELPNGGNCTYLDETGEVDVTYWYWIEAEGPSDEVMSDPMTGKKEKPIVISPITYENLRGATNPNPATYREGTLVTLANPSAVTGYTFAGWTPSQITADMTGAQIVWAAWTANGYSIAYNPNGGSGTMEPTSATYDSVTNLAANSFTWTGHVFAGWATNANGEAIYAAGQSVSNLTAQSGGVVTLYAVWEATAIAAPVISPANGATFSGDSCTVTISCETEGATIYYSTNGRTPRFTEANRYTEPFTITDTTTVIAVAVLDDQEEYAEATITKMDVPQLTLSGVLDAANLSSVTTGGDAEWEPVVSTDAKVGGSCAQSGTVGMAQSSHLEATVQGKGTLTFWWKVSCEPDPRGRHTYDNLSYAVDGTDVAWLDGETGWVQQSVTFDTAGAHTIRWTYATDDWEEPGYADCGWIDGIVWTPEDYVDPLPEVAADSDVANVLAGAADETRLRAHLSGKAQYDLFRAWVNAKGLDHQTVKNSARAWFSYAVGANGLVEKAFQNEDVTIKSLSVAASGEFSFEVDVNDVALGAAATAENLATVFGIQGAASLREGTFSSKNVTVTLGVAAHGRLSVTATPKQTSAAFFIRVLMHPDADAAEDDEGGEGGEPTVDPVSSNTYVVTYKPGANGSGTQQTSTKTHGEVLALKGATFTRSGYTQTGWSTSDGGAKAYDLGASYTANAAITLYPYWTANSIADQHDKVQLWEGGPYWATTNIGAEEPWEYGYYFWWGDTVGDKRENDAWVTSDGVIDHNGFASYYWWLTYDKDAATLQSEGWIMADGVLVPEHDAAHVKWGGTWRMPTKQELADLYNNCDWTWTTMNGVNGYVVRGRGDYASIGIFLPAAGHGEWTSFYDAGSRGYYWSSVLESNDPDDSIILGFSSSDYGTYGYSRFRGVSVRPVQGFTE